MVRWALKSHERLFVDSIILYFRRKFLFPPLMIELECQKKHCSTIALYLHFRILSTQTAVYFWPRQHPTSTNNVHPQSNYIFATSASPNLISHLYWKYNWSPGASNHTKSSPTIWFCSKIVSIINCMLFFYYFAH